MITYLFFYILINTALASTLRLFFFLSFGFSKIRHILETLDRQRNTNDNSNPQEAIWEKIYYCLRCGADEESTLNEANALVEDKKKVEDALERWFSCMDGTDLNEAQPPSWAGNFSAKQLTQGTFQYAGALKIEKLKCSKLCTILVVIIFKIIFTSFILLLLCFL